MTAGVPRRVKERAEAYGAWLDENRPGWLDRIDVETLQLDDEILSLFGARARIAMRDYITARRAAA